VLERQGQSGLMINSLAGELKIFSSFMAIPYLI